MAHGIFKKFDGFGHFVGMAMGLSLAGVFLGNFISLAILAGCEAVGLNVGEGAAIVTVPIGCAIIAAAFIVHERNKVEREANWKVLMMMQVLKSHGKLTDEEVDAFYEGMRDVEFDDGKSGEPSYGRGFGE